MPYADPFSTLELMHMPFDEQTCILGDNFVLADNFSGLDSPTDLTADRGMVPYLTAPNPIKVQFYIVMFCLGGEMRIRLNLAEHNLRRGDIAVIQPGDIGQWLGVTADSRIAIMAFTTDFVFPEADMEGAVVVRKFLSWNAVVHASDADMDEFLTIYQSMRRVIRRPGHCYKREAITGYLQVLHSYACQLMAPCVDRLEAQPRTRKKEVFDRFMQLVKENYAHERRIGFYADRLCISAKYLSQTVHHVSGRHAGDWIRDYVILEAKALLRSHRYSVQQVSDMLHFANQSFFGAYFKKAVGCSPKTYLNEA